MAAKRSGDATAVGAAEFKARCLELIDRVNEEPLEYTITRHGTPVARLVPVKRSSTKRSVFGSMRGTVLRYERPFDPVPGVWSLDAPNLDTND